MDKQQFLSQFPALVSDYQPAADVLKKIQGLTLLMIIGPSGAGKTSLIKSLDLPYVISDTTRPARPEELNGVDYYFRDDYVRIIEDIKMGRFVQAVVGPAGDFYATKESSYPAFGTAVIAAVAEEVPNFRRLGFGKTMSVFVVPPSYEEWMRRMSTHDADEQSVKRRLAEGRNSLSFALNDNLVRLVINDQLEAATNQVKNLLNNIIDENRERQAKQVCQQLLDKLGPS